MAAVLVLDTTVLLRGMTPPPGAWWTTPEAAAEVSPGGRDARRFAQWRAQGLRVAAPDDAAVERVRAAARAAGNLGRLSAADVSVLALATERGATLVSDDHTVLDVAARLGVAVLPLASRGIRETVDWRPRCTGCGRWFEERPADCPVCGSPVVDKPWKA